MSPPSDTLEPLSERESSSPVAGDFALVEVEPAEVAVVVGMLVVIEALEVLDVWELPTLPNTRTEATAATATTTRIDAQAAAPRALRDLPEG
jgi:hypothetical protein